MMRVLAPLVLKLAAVSAALFILWQGTLPGNTAFWPGGLEQIWLAWQRPVLRWFYNAMNLDAATYNMSWQLARGYVLSVLPFVALMIVAGPAGWRKAIFGLAGLVIIGCWQIITPPLLYLIRSQLGTGRSFYVGISPVFMFSYALPFVLWVIFSRDKIARWMTGISLPADRNNAK